MTIHVHPHNCDKNDHNHHDDNNNHNHHDNHNTITKKRRCIFVCQNLFSSTICFMRIFFFVITPIVFLSNQIYRLYNIFFLPRILYFFTIFKSIVGSIPMIFLPPCLLIFCLNQIHSLSIPIIFLPLYLIILY